MQPQTPKQNMPSNGWLYRRSSITTSANKPTRRPPVSKLPSNQHLNHALPHTQHTGYQEPRPRKQRSFNWPKRQQYYPTVRSYNIIVAQLAGVFTVSTTFWTSRGHKCLPFLPAVQTIPVPTVYRYMYQGLLPGIMPHQVPLLWTEI